MKLLERNIRDLYASYITWRGQRESLIGKKLWMQQNIRSYEEIQTLLKELITSGKPFFAGKIGANEQNLLHWGSGISIPTYPFGCRRLKYSQTKNCASNAGVLPRNPNSYRLFYSLLSKSLEQIDVIGIWYNPGEYQLISQLCTNSNLEKCYFFDLEPFFSQESWIRALEGKTIYLVTPFLNSCINQYQHRHKIWSNNMLPELQLKGYRFPYLFSTQTEESERDWVDVFSRVTTDLSKTDFDIAIIGCGGLSLPIAAYCKSIGKQAIHLGGAAQLLFGIRATRYEADPKYRSLMNNYWIRPPEEERPKEFMSVENGCYW